MDDGVAHDAVHDLSFDLHDENVHARTLLHASDMKSRQPGPSAPDLGSANAPSYVSRKLASAGQIRKTREGPALSYLSRKRVPAGQIRKTREGSVLSYL